ncbi:NAD-dependent epimerase/dehydratase family protein [Streptomyces sp. NPDC087420]|uniref:NAD-dependent epimerase/dehydratase family protein n=1 Tax=Streptomyces sp. NPDC087420 TaxID=3365785 RepID=UPI00383657A1
MSVTKVFLTGGSGYVGRPTVAALVRRGITVAALARSEHSARRLSRLGAEPVRGTLTDTAVLREAASRADGVIHLGSDVGPGGDEVDRAAAEALLDGVGAGPYVHTGGAWVYGDTDGVTDEDAPQKPPALTAWRRANEDLVLGRAATGGHPVLVMPGVVYGHGAGLIEMFYTAPARERGAAPVIGDGRNHWGVVHVDDIAELYALALGAPAGSVYVGVSEEAPTQADIAAAAAEAAGHPGRTESLSLEAALERMGPIAEAFALDQRMTSARARRDTGWQPRHVDDVLTEIARPTQA